MINSTQGLLDGVPLELNGKNQYFTAYVRLSRYTYEILEKPHEFTVSVPLGDYDKGIHHILQE